MAQQSHPLPPIVALQQPQPEGPLREGRINLLLTLDTSQLALNFQTITLLLHEIQEYNDHRLQHLIRKLKRQKKIQEIAALTLKEMLTFNLREIEQTQAMIEWLDDQRLAQQKGLLRFARYNDRRKKEMKKPPLTFVQTLKDVFPFSFLYPKQQPKKEEEQWQQLSYESQRQVGVNQFNFKYD